MEEPEAQDLYDQFLCDFALDEDDLETLRAIRLERIAEGNEPCDDQAFMQWLIENKSPAA